jgi:hypothetical protein
MTTKGIGGTEDAKPTIFKLGTKELGATPYQPEPAPKRITWKKKNRVTTHEIPGFKDRTQRTSVETLWECSFTVRTVLSDTRNDLKKIVDEVGPFTVEDDFPACPLQMYIISCDASRIEGEDPQVYEWSITLLECND